MRKCRGIVADTAPFRFWEQTCMAFAGIVGLETPLQQGNFLPIILYFAIALPKLVVTTSLLLSFLVTSSACAETALWSEMVPLDALDWEARLCSAA